MITEDIILSELITSEWLQVACTLYKEEAMGRIYDKSEMDGMESEVTRLMSWARIPFAPCSNYNVFAVKTKT